MSRGRSRFKQCDVERAVKGAQKGAQAAGLTVTRTEVDLTNGRVVIHHTSDHAADPADAALSDFLSKKATRHARPS